MRPARRRPHATTDLRIVYRVRETRAEALERRARARLEDVRAYAAPQRRALRVAFTLAWPLVIVVVMVGATRLVVAGGVRGGPVYQARGGALNCNQSAANASQLTTAVTAATIGQTVCLTASVDYGDFNGTNKAITIVAADGVNPKMFLQLGTGDTGFTIDGNHRTWNDSVGLTLLGANFAGSANSPTNITIKDAWFVGIPGVGIEDGVCSSSVSGDQGGGCIETDLDDTMTSRNVLIQHNVFKNIQAHKEQIGPNPDCESSDWRATATEAVIRMTDEGTSGWTIKDNLILDTTADGLKIGGNATITNNLIINDRPPPGNPECLHADAAQLWTARGSHVRGNWIRGCEQGLDSFDGMGIADLSHNLITDCDTHHITLYGYNEAHGDVHNNTIHTNIDFIAGNHGRLECGNRTGDPTSIPSLYDNVFRRMVMNGAGNNCAPTRDDHNQCDPTMSCAGTSQLIATPTFVGGNDPTTWDSMDDACLTGPSLLMTGATNGGQVGLCGDDWNAATDGPPEGEGYP